LQLTEAHDMEALLATLDSDLPTLQRAVPAVHLLLLSSLQASPPSLPCVMLV
jgi:hypothetical protein